MPLLTTTDFEGAEALSVARKQRSDTFHESLGAQDALREAEKELLDLLPPAALRKLRVLREQARANRMQAYAELLAGGVATDDQVRDAFGRAYEAQQRAICLAQKG
jgi:hypothetical protein